MSDKSFFTTVRGRLITGFLTVLPAALTVWVVLLIARLADWFSQPIFRLLFDTSIPGLGVVVTLILLYLIGGIVQNRILSRVVSWAENLVNKLPLVGKMYSAVKQTVEAFKLTSADEKFRRVVFVEYPKSDSWVLAFVTREMDFNGKKSVALFIPTTPNPTSGFLIVVPEMNTLRTNMSIEEAAKFIISGGVLMPQDMQIGLVTTPPGGPQL